MAKRLVNVRYCDRCPVNKRKPAVHKEVPFGFGDTKWKIDLCEPHFEMLGRDMYSWGLLARSVEDDEKSTFAQTPELRRLAELRAKQAKEDREIALAGRDYSVVTTGSRLVERLGGVDAPHGHDEWNFTQHALDRLEERELDVVEVLWACEKPQNRYTAREPGLWAYERNETRVILNPSTKVIITVAWRNNEKSRKAVGL